MIFACYYLLRQKGLSASRDRQSLIELYSRFRCFVMILAHTRYKMTMTMIE